MLFRYLRVPHCRPQMFAITPPDTISGDARPFGAELNVKSRHAFSEGVTDHIHHRGGSMTCGVCDADCVVRRGLGCSR